MGVIKRPQTGQASYRCIRAVRGMDAISFDAQFQHNSNIKLLIQVNDRLIAPGSSSSHVPAQLVDEYEDPSSSPPHLYPAAASSDMFPRHWSPKAPKPCTSSTAGAPGRGLFGSATQYSEEVRCCEVHQEMAAYIILGHIIGGALMPLTASMWR